VERRIRTHKGELKHNKHPLQQAQDDYNLHGADSFVFEVLEYVSEDELLQKEIEYSLAEDQEKLYNKKIGYNHTDEMKQAISAYMMGVQKGKKLSDETRAKISAAQKGRKRGPTSDETRAKIGAAHRGRTLSDEQKAKIGASRRATAKLKPMSDEQKAKMSAKLKGRKRGPVTEEQRANIRAGQLGKKLSDEHKAAIAAGLKRKAELKRLAQESVT
jgi:group I intron endonuclease